MGGITSPPSVRALFTRFYNTFDQGLQSSATDLGVLAEQINLPEGESASFEWLGGFPRFREWIGQRYVHGLAQRAFVITTKPYESTIAVDRFKFDDNTLLSKDRVVRGMAAQAANLPRDLLLDLLVNGHARPAYDGQNFFDTDHPIVPDGSTGTQSNYQSSAFALTRDNFVTARSRIRRFKAEGGRVFGNRGRLKLVVPEALSGVAEELLTLDFVEISGVMQRNPTRGSADLIVVPELDDVSTTAWYLFEVGTNGADAPPFVILERESPKIYIKDGPTDEQMFWAKEITFGAHARYGAGYGAWNRAFKGVG
jgi:phage major head subunit gpT-like protein